MAAPTSMPEIANLALVGHQPLPVSASSPYVTDPPGFGDAAAATVAEADGPTPTSIAVAPARAMPAAAILVRSAGRRFTRTAPPGHPDPVARNGPIRKLLTGTLPERDRSGRA